MTIERGDTVRYQNQKYRVYDLGHGLALIENEYDTKVAPVVSLTPLPKEKEA